MRSNQMTFSPTLLPQSFKTALGVTLAAVLMAIATPPADAKADDVKTTPPAGFVKVSDALKNPGMAFVPGLGTLYVDPRTLPAGPFLGYDKGGKLINVTYMLPTAIL